MNTSNTSDLLILGLGNPLFGDDGVGVLVVEKLQSAYVWPRSVTLLDGGTLGLSLLPYIQGAKRAIFVDAIRTGAEPGSVIRMRGEEVSLALPPRLSPHELGVADIVFGALASDVLCPKELVLLGIVPEKLSFGLRLSAVATAALPSLAQLVVDEARMMGFEVQRREVAATDTQRLADGRPGGWGRLL